MKKKKKGLEMIYSKKKGPWLTYLKGSGQKRKKKGPWLTDLKRVMNHPCLILKVRNKFAF